MKRMITVIVVALTLALLSCAHSRMPKSNSHTIQLPVQTSDCSLGKTIANQNRINRYFHSEVIPKLKRCWNRVQGKGTIAIEFSYTKAGNNWLSEKLSITGSTLPKGQEAVALRCMQDSVRGTSFPITESEGTATEFYVHWGWPVPWPGDISEVARMIDTGGGGGGCGGKEGPAPSCQDCIWDPATHTASCKKTCTGYKDCREDGTGKGCTMGPRNPPCATGWPFGNVGGIVIY